MNIAIKKTPFFISILKKIHTIKESKYLYFIPECIEETENPLPQTCFFKSQGFCSGPPVRFLFALIGRDQI